MKKQKETTHQFKYLWISIFVIFLLTISLFMVLYYQMPKRECHDEITIEKVDLNGGSYLDYQSRGIYENDEFTCEDGIEVGDLRRIGIIWFVGYDGTCLIKHINKVCETK